MTNLAEEIRQVIKGEVEDDNKSLATYSTDASLFFVKPQVVVHPINANDVCELVKYVAAKKAAGQKVSLTARAAGTDMTGGPLSESIVVSFIEHFNKVIEVGEGYAVTQPGVFYRDFEAATLAKGYQFPSYPASRDLCAMGGIINNNSGGEKSLQYGKTADYIDELKMVWRDGEVHNIRPLSRAELEEKLTDKGIEGEVYGAIYTLVNEHADILASAKPIVTKNSAGYALWDIYDKTTGRFDLTRLFVGAQGTLGLVTEARIRLVKPHEHRQMLVISMKDLNLLPEIVNRVLEYKPETFESYDNHTFRVALKYLPEILQSALGKHLISLGLKLIPAAFKLASGGIPKLVLLAEFAADTEEEARLNANRAAQSLKHLDVTLRLTHSQAEADTFLAIRRESFSLLRKHVHGMHTAPFIDDVIVQPKDLPTFLPELNKILDRYKLIYTVAGHVGNGNFHIIPLVHTGDKGIAAMVPKLSEEVFDLVIKYHGSIDGEHNDGLIRTPYLQKQFGPEVCELFAEVKKILDPDNIFNPGKKVGGSTAYSMSHLNIN